MKTGYPVLLDLRQRTVVIVGGGAVAARKARGVLEAGAGRVVAVAKAFCEEFPTAREGVERIVGEFEPGHLEGADLVFAATDSAEVNAAVVREARRPPRPARPARGPARGVWVNRVDGEATKRRSDEATDGGERGDFDSGAVLREGGVVVGVWAGSAGVAVAVRDEVRKSMDRRWGKLAEAMEVLRPRVLSGEDPRGGLSRERRREVLRALATPEALEVLEREGVEGVWRWAVENSKSK